VKVMASRVVFDNLVDVSQCLDACKKHRASLGQVCK